MLGLSSFEDWLYRKANENSHNEILAFLMVILGVNLLMGGLLLTVLQVGELSFLTLLDPILLGSSIHVAFILTLTGFLLIAAGFILVIYYDRQKSWFVSELTKSTTYQKKKNKTFPK